MRRTQTIERLGIVAGCCFFVFVSVAHAGDRILALSEATCPNDTLEVIGAINIMSVIDPRTEKRLRRCRDLGTIRKTIERTRRTNDTLWDIMEDRLQYCLNKGYCPIAGDVRVRMVLDNGPWTSEWIEPMDCGGDTCMTWVYVYPPCVEHPAGRSIVCTGNAGEDYPTQIFSDDGVAARISGPIFPFVMPLLMPEWNTDSHSVSIGVTVPADQLSQSTLDLGLLQMTLRVSRVLEDGQRQVVAEDNVVTNLGPLRGILARSFASEWNRRGAQGYLSCKLGPGDYSLVVDVSGARNNAGRVELGYSVPANPNFSDIILIRDARGSGLDAGVGRGEKYFYSVSRPEFVQGTDVTFRLEFQLPAEYRDQYHIWVTLTPIPDRRPRDESSHGTVMPVVYWEDEEGNPRYGSSVPQDLLLQSSEDRNSKTLIDRSCRIQERIVVFEENIRLSAKPGRYLLSAQVSESSKRQKPMGLKTAVVKILPR